VRFVFVLCCNNHPRLKGRMERRPTVDALESRGVAVTDDTAQRKRRGTVEVREALEASGIRGDKAEGVKVGAEVPE
jgi:hypothetical protein